MAKCEKNIPPLYADQRLMRQIFINLAGNAVKFSESNSTVIIEAAIQPDGDLCIAVIDEGIGIPSDKIDQALEPFGQINERAENAQNQGTGLGLPLAKAMVDLHGGTLDIQSEEGEGTTVYVTLPARRLVPEKDKQPLAEKR